MRGARFIAAAAFYFLFPIVSAMLLAVFAGSDPERRSLAALFGLAIGIALAAAAGRWCTQKLERRARLPEQTPRVSA